LNFVLKDRAVAGIVAAVGELDRGEPPSLAARIAGE
jgi:hypothetical protein